MKQHSQTSVRGSILLKALVSWIHPDDYAPVAPSTTTTLTSPPDKAVTAAPSSIYNFSMHEENQTCLTLSANCTYIACDDVSFNCSLCDDSLNSCGNCDACLAPTMNNIGLALFLYLFCFATVIGNALVIIAVFQECNLHSATNYLIASLAVADSLVGLVVMPFSATYEVMDQAWVFGPVWCELWHSLDVLASTASILHLCVISLDRYWAITDPFNYPVKMNDKRAGYLIVLVWVCSSSISFPAILWWRVTAEGPAPPWKCPFTDDIGYLVFSSTVSFYGPLAVMVFTYIKIFQAATAYSKSLSSGQKLLGSAKGEGEITLRIHRGGGAGAAKKNELLKLPSIDSEGSSSPGKPVKKKGAGVSRKLAKFNKETRAAKTLGTVMGVFIICWLPFFVTNVIAGICPSCISNPEVTFAILNWLGWVNSSMNPVIYACCSMEFRRAFAKILCFCCPGNSLTQCWNKLWPKEKEPRDISIRDSLLKEDPKVITSSSSYVQNGDAVNNLKATTVIPNCNGTNGANGLSKSPASLAEIQAKLKVTDKLLESQYMSAKYAVNYRSLDSTSSSANSCDERALSSCEESMPSLPMQGGKGKSFFPVNGAAGITRKINSFYSIPPPNFSFRPGVSNEKLL